MRSPVKAPRRPSARTIGPVSLSVVRGPDKEGRWYWRARVGQEVKWTGWGFVSEAEREVAALVAADGLDAPRNPETAPTIQDLLELWNGWMAERPDVTEGTVKNALRRSRTLLPILGAVRAERLDLSTLEGFRDARIRSGAASRTVDLELRLLRQAWGWGRSRGLIPDKDLPKVSVRVRDVRERYTPPPAEVEAVLSHLSGWPYIVLRLLASTGCRRGEIASLTWDKVDLQGRTLLVTGKTGTRRVPIVPEVADWLATLPRATATVHGTSPSNATGALWRFLDKACKRAGVPRWTPHGLRRAAVNALYRCTDPSVAGKILGHSPVVALQTYRQVTDEEAREAMEKAALGATLPGSKVLPFQGKMAHRRGTGGR